MHRLENEITIGNGIHGVVENALKTELLGHGNSIDLEWVTSKGTGAERAAVDTLGDFAETFELICERESVGKKPMAPSYWLCFLEMSVSWHLAFVSCQSNTGHEYRIR